MHIVSYGVLFAVDILVEMEFDSKRGEHIGEDLVALSGDELEANSRCKSLDECEHMSSRFLESTYKLVVRESEVIPRLMLRRARWEEPSVFHLELTGHSGVHKACKVPDQCVIYSWLIVFVQGGKNGSAVDFAASHAIFHFAVLPQVLVQHWITLVESEWWRELSLGFRRQIH